MPEGVDSKKQNKLQTDVQKKLHKAHFVCYSVTKRGMDLVISAGLLTVLLPLLLMVGVAIKIDSPGPAFFKQKRTGKKGKVFYILKFRSMAVDNDVMDASCEDKYTRIGGILRRTSVDELPQLINVFLGQMSLIGPRPWVPEYWNNMTEEERRRGLVRPGITGLAAASGRNGLTVFEKIGYDLEYVDNFSLMQDIKVIGLTVKTVLKKEGAEEGKSGIHNEIDELVSRDRGPNIRVILDVNPLTSVVVWDNGKGALGMDALEMVGAATGRNYDALELVVMNDELSDKAKGVARAVMSDKVKVIGKDGVNVGDIDRSKGRFWCFVDDGDNGGSWRPGEVAKWLNT